MQEENELLSNLYTIRAGLSVIAQEKANVDRIINDADRRFNSQSKRISAENEAAAKAREAKISELKSEEDFYKKLKLDLSRAKSEANINFQRARLTDEIDKKKRELTKSEKKLGKIRSKRFWAVTALICSIILLLGGVATVGYFFGSCKACVNSDIGDILGRIILLLGGGIVGVGLGIFFIYKCTHKFYYRGMRQDVKEEKQRLKEYNGELKDKTKNFDRIAEEYLQGAKNLVTAIERDIETTLSRIESAKKNLSSAEESKALAVQTGIAVMAEERKLKVAQYQIATKKVNLALALFNVLNENFGKTLDVRDWGNLDMVIYCIETNRADSVKEALQQVDKQRQTDRLAEAISIAGEAISKTVREGLSYLHRDMIKCFTQISDMMILQTQAMAAGMMMINASVNGLSSDIQVMTSASEMNNALLRQANVSSERLIGEVTELRRNSEYVAIRNGKY